jgi:hypothetical protein
VAEGSSDDWVVASSSTIEVLSLNYYAMECLASGVNATDFNIVVRFLDEDEDEIGLKVLYVASSDTFDSQKAFSIFLTPKGTAMIRFEVRFWLNSASVWWKVEGFRMMDLSRSVSYSPLQMHMDVEDGGRYHILVRVYRSEIGGVLCVLLDGERVAYIETESPLNRFEWIDLGPFSLSKGRHEIGLVNMDGFNAVNLVLLVEEGTLLEGMERARMLAKSKTVVYILEAERNFYREGCIIEMHRDAGCGYLVRVTSISNEYVEPVVIRGEPQTGVIPPSVPAPISLCNITAACCVDGSVIERLRYRRLPSRGSHIEVHHEGSILKVHYRFSGSMDPVHADWEVEGVNLRRYDTLVVDILGDGSGNMLQLWYYSEASRKWIGVGSCRLTWIGWRRLELDLPRPKCGSMDIFRLIIEYGETPEGSGNHTVSLSEPMLVKRRGFSLYRRLTILKDGWYTLAIRGSSGVFRARIGDTEAVFNLTKWGWETREVYLDEGVHELRVSSPSRWAKIDGLLLTSGDLRLLLANGFMEILDQVMVSPTRWRVTVDPSRRYLLAFGESYDPGWTAIVDGVRYHSIPINGILNGFIIRGDERPKTILIWFWPQGVFRTGWLITAICVSTSLCYLGIRILRLLRRKDRS